MYVRTDELLLNRYKITSKLGSGGFSEVYEAFDTRMERIVAIKQIHVDRRSAERVIREARTVALLNHPNIVTLHEFEEDGDDYYLIMELIEGVPLSKILARLAPLPVEEALVVAGQICRALTAAHEHGIVHRDIKPENVMVLNDGRLKVMDFGIATIKGASTTTSGDIIGTFSYMSPEQARGDIVDERSDIFSLGTLLYEMLTDAIPFSGESANETLNQVQKSDPPPPSAINALIDAPVDAVVMRALEKDPDERYESAFEFRASLEGMLGDTALPEKTLALMMERYGRYAEGHTQYELAGWRGNLWLFFDEHGEPAARTAIAMLLAAPFFPILHSWFGIPRSLTLFGAATIFLMVLLLPGYGVGLTLVLLAAATATHSTGVFIVALTLAVPYWATISRWRPALSVWPAAGAVFGFLRIPFVFPVAVGLLAGPVTAAFIAGLGCLVFELVNIFAADTTAPMLVQSYGLWSMLGGETDAINVVQLMSGPFIENPFLLLQPVLWAIVATTTSFIKRKGRWLSAVLSGFVVLVLGYQGAFANLDSNSMDTSALMQDLSFSLIILLLLPIIRPPKEYEHRSEGADEQAPHRIQGDD